VTPLLSEHDACRLFGMALGFVTALVYFLGPDDRPEPQQYQHIAGLPPIPQNVWRHT
jgi:hypothetical protein